MARPLHRCRRINPSVEANLSHLSISYSGPPTASSTNGATTAAGADAPADDSPLGFLSHLVDQLLVGGKSQPDPAPADTASADSATPDVATPATVDPASLFNLNADAAAPVTPQATSLLTKLTNALKTLKAELDAGQKPDADTLKDLGDAADALSALIATPASQPSVTPADPSSTLDPLKALAAADTTQQPQATGIPETKPDKDKPATDNAASDQLSQLLASMGITLPSATQQSTSPSSDTQAADTVGATPSIGNTTQPLPAVAELAQKLTELTAAIRPIAPDVAQKLDALTQKLTAAETDPKTALAQLTAPSDSDGAVLDKLVQQLISAKPVAAPTPSTPQLASNTKLDIPTPIAPKTPQVTTPDQPVAPDPTPTTASVDPKIALKPTTTAKPIDPAPADKPKANADTKATAAAIADTTKSDAPDSTTQAQQANAAAPVAQNAPARAIPAAYQTASNPINMGQVAFEMARQLHQGQSRFTIRIDPPELGRVDVKMHVDSAGNVNARLTVERAETLDMFQRDKGSLEKALTQAGLDAGKTNLEFSLKQNPFAGMTGGDQRQQGNGGYPRARFATDDDQSVIAPLINLYRGTASAGGVNIFA